MKNTIEGINNQINEADGWINELGNKVVEITSSEQNKEKKSEKKWGQFKRPLEHHQHSHYRSYRKRREKGPEKILQKK